MSHKIHQLPTIKQSAYEVCKAIKQSEKRSVLQDIITGVRYSKEDEKGAKSPDDRAMLGYEGNKQGCQILGYLLVEQERESYLRYPIPRIVPAFHDEERELLRHAHEQIQAMNRLCVSEAVARRPNISEAVDPYSDMPLLRPRSHPAPPGEDGPLPFHVMREASIVFQMHPALQFIQSAPFPSGREPKMKDLAAAVRRVKDAIKQVGVFNSPTDMESVVMGQPVDAPTRQIFLYILALHCIRSSLKVFNQMMFQSICSDNLNVLSSENIIEVSRVNSNLIGKGLEIQYQPDNRCDVVIDLDEIVLVKSLDNSVYSYMVELDILCEVDTYSTSFSAEWGVTGKLMMRGIDEYLCPCSSVLELLRKSSASCRR